MNVTGNVFCGQFIQPFIVTFTDVIHIYRCSNKNVVKVTGLGLSLLWELGPSPRDKLSSLSEMHGPKTYINPKCSRSRIRV